MFILMIILGALMIMCGMTSVVTPLATLMGAGYFILTMMLVYGIAGIIRGIVTKVYGVEFLFSILSVIFGFIIILVPGFRLLTEGALIYFVAVWFILQGVVSVFTALRAKSHGNKNWVFGLVSGILGIILGIYSCIQPAVLAISIGILIGIYFIITGINMITLALALRAE